MFLVKNHLACTESGIWQLLSIQLMCLSFWFLLFLYGFFVLKFPRIWHFCYFTFKLFHIMELKLTHQPLPLPVSIMFDINNDWNTSIDIMGHYIHLVEFITFKNFLFSNLKLKLIYLHKHKQPHRIKPRYSTSL
jgi:hypothetical protein